MHGAVVEPELLTRDVTIQSDLINMINIYNNGMSNTFSTVYIYIYSTHSEKT